MVRCSRIRRARCGAVACALSRLRDTDDHDALQLILVIAAAHRARRLLEPTGDLAAQDRDIMPWYQDLHVFRRVVTSKQYQSGEQTGHNEVHEAEEHECRG